MEEIFMFRYFSTDIHVYVLLPDMYMYYYTELGQLGKTEEKTSFWKL